jgi:2-oxoisovalerate dehydrogenase E2 component (dihydrolipoyl transacylase)
MALHVVKVPDIGEGIAEVELVAWHVGAGDAVAADQVLADVMTDKATVEVPSPVVGRVVAVRGAPGDRLAVGSELLRIETEAAVAPPHAVTLPHDVTPREMAAPPAAAAGVVAPAPESSAAVTPIGKPLASPAVRRHARELDVDLAEVRGSGPDGRVLHDDLVRHAAARRGTGPAADRTAGPTSEGVSERAAGRPAGRAGRPAGVPRYAPRDGEREVPVIGLRRQIAQRMAESLRIPHFTYVEEIDVTELETLRARLNERHAAGRGRLTLLPFLVRALAVALPSFPQLNARYDDAKGVVTQFAAVHLGIATQTGAGLTVPVVRHAEALDLWACAAEIARLAEAVRAGRATREELSGSTITVTSLGPLGGIVTTPVINPPEVAIVGVNRIVERPAIHAGAVVARKLMNLSSSFDHRVVDGATAAEFVQAMKGALECPALLFVD